MAESERFELSVRYHRTHAFQACSFNHSDNSPRAIKIKLFTSATLASLARFKESCQEKKAAQRQILRVHIILNRRQNMREFVCLSSCAIILPFPYCTLHKFCIFPASISASYSCSCSSSCFRRLSSNASDISSRALMASFS